MSIKELSTENLKAAFVSFSDPGISDELRFVGVLGGTEMWLDEEEVARELAARGELYTEDK